MKTIRLFLSIAIAAMIFSACSNDIESGQTKNVVNLRSQSEAINIAVNAHDAFFSKNSRGTNHVGVAVGGVQVIKGRSSRGLNNDTLLYVVNYEDNGGFALVSASPTTEALIGIAEDGNYQPGEKNNNPNFQFYLDQICNNIGNTMNQASVSFDPIGIIPIGPDLPPRDSIPFADIYTVTASKGPYVDLKWGQDYPYGSRFENGKCGSAVCVAAMIATHLHWPWTYRVDGEYIDWDELSQHKSNNDGCNESDSAHVHSSIANLIYKLGDRRFHYCEGDTTFYNAVGAALMDALFYNSACYEEHEVTTMDDLIFCLDYPEFGQGRLVYATETREVTIDGGTYDDMVKYCWLIDGYKTVRYTFREAPQITYLHCNWANDGNSNGYFLPTEYFSNVLHYDSSSHNFSTQFVGEISYYVATADYLTNN